MSSEQQSHTRPSSLDRQPLSSTSTFLILTFLCTLLLPLVSAAPPCVRFADYDSINQMFIDGGPGTKVFLCPNKLYRLSGTIVFTAADQELATYGYPTGSERAILRVEGKQTSTVVQGDCRRCARVGVRSLIIDGNRKKLGRIKNMDDAAGLVILGGNEGQSIKHCWIKNPRGFTAVHIREGDKLQCTGAVIDKNEIGPVGEEYDPELDGEDPEMSPLGRPLADGLSIACRDSFVRDNTFYDNTDASIVIYCSPGTLVLANHITARSLSSMAGILLVDQTPFDGDYTGVTVKQNIIDAASRSIRVGIGIGSTVWSDDTETILKGGSVLNNGLKGRYMGYGIAAAGLEGFKVKGNWDEAQHQGQRSARCFDEPVNPDPMAFLYNLETIKDSEFQSGFKDHDFQYVVCIDGLYDNSNPPKHDLPPLPHDLENEEAKEQHLPPKKEQVQPKKKDSADAKEQSEEEEEEDKSPETPGPSTDGFSTGSEVMDDILEHSQQRMLEAIDHLHRRVDVLASNVAQADKGKSKKSESVGESLDPAISTHLEKLQRRVEHLETSQKNLLDSAIAMRSSVQSWDQEMATIGEWQYDILLDVRHKLDLHSSHADIESGFNPSMGERDGEILNEINSPRVDHTHPSIDRENIRDLSNKQRLKSEQGDGKEGWGWWIKVLVLQCIVAVGVWLARGWWRRRRVHGKIL
ncbi:hypothetical protein I302_101698 [Kwoniella bestiolae CBS 10118]|uniref:Right handed beta helix domain-containing protein n=1 Tax=Kwoniella bestiolae CBS 10118 TaxID=1296100 RepID=A0A1B9GCY6_9TREE|nr:hypothetical protein I302_00374 [Kwoniella bestiolae CBS 10118]OCF28884.1 hypothetical protein I302_00374 [Kwoniella bestiolae CBS 10118]